MSEPRQADEPLSQRQEQLDRHIASKVDDLLRGLHDQIGERVRSVSDDLLGWLEQNAPEIPGSFLGDFDIAALIEKDRPEPTQAQSSSTEALLAAVSRIDSETSQAEILAGLLEEAGAFASRSAFFLIREDQVRGWASYGFGDDRAQTVEDSTSQTPWSTLLEMRATAGLSDDEAERLADRLGGESPNAAIVVPFAIRGEISAAFYADQTEEGALDTASIQLLVHSACMALETVTVSPGKSATLERQGDTPSTAVPKALLATAAAAAAAAAATVARAPEQEEEPEHEEQTTQDAEAEALSEPVETAAEAEASESAVDEAAETVAAETEAEKTQDDDAEAQDAEAHDAVAAWAEEEPPIEESEAASEPAAEAEEVFEEDEEPTAETAVEVDPPAAETAADGIPQAEDVLQATEPVPVTEASEPSESAPIEEAFTVEDAPSYAALEETDVPTDDEIALEAAEPEPELEDTNIWELEEDEDEDDEPTHVGKMVRAPEDVPRVAEAPTPEPASAPEPAETGIGQETVRIDLADLPQGAGAESVAPVVPASPELPVPAPVVAPQPLEQEGNGEGEGAFGDDTSPTLHAATAKVTPSASGFAGPPPTSFADPAPPAATPELETPELETPSPEVPSLEAPAPETLAPPPTSFADPPTSFAAPAPTEVSPPVDFAPP
ncbi:MAG: hypothetical protein AAF725_09250, partial [Acidobacteriota bacterium]